MNKVCVGVWVSIVLCLAACSSTPQRQGAPVRDLFAALQAADVQYRKRDFAAAESAYRNVLAIDPQSADANNRLGVIAHQRGEYALAEQYFNRVLVDNPRNETAAYN